jgi:hypothetical protein
MKEVTLQDVYYVTKLVQLGWTMKNEYWIQPEGNYVSSLLDQCQIYWDVFDQRYTFEQACDIIRK